MVRTEAGRGPDGRFDTRRIQEVLALGVEGPFLVVLPTNGSPELAFPAPADSVRLEGPTSEAKTHQLRRLVPLALAPGEQVSGARANPVGMPNPTLEKPARDAPPFWTATRLAAWLDSPGDQQIPAAQGVCAPKVEPRVHVAVGQDLTAEEGQLFTTGGRRFAGKVDDATTPLGIFLRSDARLGRRTVKLGGEGRLSLLTPAPGTALPQLSKATIDTARRGFVRAYFATPACFGEGSKWSPPAHARIVSQAHSRAVVISGWEMTPPGAGRDDRYSVAANPGARGGRPKPIRRLLPAGAVFFLELTGSPDANESFVTKLHARSVHDGQDGRDGLGIVLFGAWDGQLVPLSSSQP